MTAHILAAVCDGAFGRGSGGSAGSSNHRPEVEGAAPLALSLSRTQAGDVATHSASPATPTAQRQEQR